MRVLVTGATGFVGRHVVRALRSHGHRVRALYHRQPALADWQEDTGIEVVHGSVLDPSSLIEATRDVDAIIHLVGIILERGESTFQRIHVEGTQNVVAAAEANGVRRIIHMSALGVRPHAPSKYHQTKGQAEEILHSSKINWTIFRPSVIFGSGGEFCRQMADLVRLTPIVPVLTTPSGRIQPVAVEEVAEAFAVSLDRPETFSQIIDLGGLEKMDLRRLLRTFAAAMRRRRLFMPIPAAWVCIPVRLMERLLTTPPMTSDQLIMLAEDNTCDTSQSERLFNIPRARLLDAVVALVRAGEIPS